MRIGMSRNNRRSTGTMIMAGVVVMATMIIWVACRRAPATGEAQGTDTNSSAAEEQPAAAPAGHQVANDDSELRAQSAGERLAGAQLPAVIQPISRPVTQAETPAPAIARVEPTPYTRQLVAGLTNLDFSHGPITKEQAAQWKQTLQSLTSQGAAALPAIR